MRPSTALSIAQGVYEEKGARGTVRLVRVTWKHREVLKPTIRKAIRS